MEDLHCRNCQLLECELGCPLLPLPPPENALFTSPIMWWRHGLKRLYLSWHFWLRRALVPKVYVSVQWAFHFAYPDRVPHKWPAPGALLHVEAFHPTLLQSLEIFTTSPAWQNWYIWRISQQTYKKYKPIQCHQLYFYNCCIVVTEFNFFTGQEV